MTTRIILHYTRNLLLYSIDDNYDIYLRPEVSSLILMVRMMKSRTNKNQ